MQTLRAFSVAFLLCLTTACGTDFSSVSVAGKRVTVCRVEVSKEPLQLFLRDNAGQPLKSFDGINRWLQPQGRKLLFAMNAGMYHANYAPVGLFVENGRQIAPISLANGDGNFFLKPNGVFLVSKSGARVIDSTDYATLREPALLATQSGPLLVRANRIHPAFKADSDSRLFRNGVGVASPSVVFFAITEEPVNLHEFATLFRDVLHCPDALFFDGTVSSLYAPSLKRNDKKIDLGPIVGIVGPISDPDAKESSQNSDQSATNPAPATDAADKTPLMIEVLGKPGFMQSPFALGLIDVRGFPSGTEVKCPYTGKIMRIP